MECNFQPLNFTFQVLVTPVHPGIPIQVNCIDMAVPVALPHLPHQNMQHIILAPCKHISLSLSLSLTTLSLLLSLFRSLTLLCHSLSIPVSHPPFSFFLPPHVLSYLNPQSFLSLIFLFASFTFFQVINNGPSRLPGSIVDIRIPNRLAGNGADMFHIMDTQVGTFQQQFINQIQSIRLIYKSSHFYISSCHHVLLH